MGLISTLSGSTHGNTGTRTVCCGFSLGCCMIAVQIPVGVVSCALSLGRVRQDHRVSVRPTLASRLQYSSVQGRFASHCHRVVVTHHNSGGGRVGGAAQRTAPAPACPTARSSARLRRAARCSRRVTNWTKRRTTRTSTTLTKVIDDWLYCPYETIPYATALLPSR
jgi:hypothetical protein